MKKISILVPAVAAGVDAIGFVMYDKSPRYVTPQRAAELARRLPPFVTPVLLFVNEAPEQAAAGVAVVDVDQARLAHRGHDPDRLVTRGQAESVRCLHDPRGVDELLVVVAGDGRVRNGVRVDRDAWLLRAGQAQIVAVVATQQDEAEHEAQDQGGDERGDDEDA